MIKNIMLMMVTIFLFLIILNYKIRLFYIKKMKIYRNLLIISNIQINIIKKYKLKLEFQKIFKNKPQVN